jgi:hypothetical protein
VARLPEACVSTLFAVLISAAGTCHSLAAAAMSMARAVAPADRICMKELAIEVDPPVICISP